MDFLLLLIGMSILLIYMLKPEWLLANNSIFWIILTYCLLLFGCSYLLIGLGIGDPEFIKALRMPLICFAIFRIMVFVFRKLFKREPENTFWVFEKKPIKDVVFSFLFWVLGVVLPVVIVLNF